MPEVVITEFMDPDGVSALVSDFDALYDPSLADDRHRLLGVLAGTRALVVRNKTIVDSRVLEAAPDLGLVARLGVGLDNIDTSACAARGIEVVPATGANAVAVAEYVIAALLILTRGLSRHTADVAAGRWPRSQARGAEIAGKTLGLLGYGLISRVVASRAAGMGMRVSAHDPYLPHDMDWGIAARVDWDRLLSGSDCMSVHVPLTPETRGMIGPAEIAAMAPGAIVVNTSRGGVVDEDAVVEALRSGHLGGAALDVFATEPLDARAGARFVGIPNLVLTPHIAGITFESERRVAEMTVETVRAHLRPSS